MTVAVQGKETQHLSVGNTILPLKTLKERKKKKKKREKLKFGFASPTRTHLFLVPVEPKDAQYITEVGANTAVRHRPPEDMTASTRYHSQELTTFTVFFFGEFSIILQHEDFSEGAGLLTGPHWLSSFK